MTKNTIDIFESINDLEAIKTYLNNGGDVNARNGHNETPLMLAASHCNLEILKLLIDNGGDVNARDDGGYTPLMWATIPLVAKILINNGADVNARNNWNETALIVAFKALQAPKEFSSMTSLLENYGAVV